MGLQVDLDKAFGLYFQAAKAGHTASCYRTALSCEVGIGTKRDPQKALQFYRRAASSGDVPSMYKLGNLLNCFKELTCRGYHVKRITWTTCEHSGRYNMASTCSGERG